MKIRKMLGIIVVMAMLMTVITAIEGNVEATSSNDTGVQSYLVIVRTPKDQQPMPKPNIAGNAYQDDKFGVEIIVKVQGYDYDPDDLDTIKLYPVALVAKGSNAGDYKIKWLELDVTKFSFESINSKRTPHATDYESSLNDMNNGFMMYNLTNDGTNYLIENWIDVESDIAGAAAGLAAGAVTSEASPLASFAASTAAQGVTHYLVSKTLHSFFNVENHGFVYGGSGENPWISDSTQGHTYMAARGVAPGDNTHKNAILAGKMEWQLDDNNSINDRIHVLTLKAVLCYAKMMVVAGMMSIK